MGAAPLGIIETLCALLSSLVLCMETIQDESQNWYIDTLTDARDLLLAITSPEFIAPLVITQRVHTYTTGITHSLQAESRDIMEAVGSIDTLRDALQSVRDSVDVYHRDGLVMWRRCAEKWEQSLSYPGIVASSSIMPIPQPR